MQARLQQLRGEMEELRPDRTLFRLIEVRGRAATYTQHLGIISLIRSDFQKMSELLARLADERGNFKERPPIQRIILYIDDLDRCRPDRVVQVLEAVHLLLAFPLFIVVVGVDPRWLRHSLAKYYPDTLTEDGPDGSDGVAVNAPRSSTPQDYLEKIFQIPLRYGRWSGVGTRSWSPRLLKPLSIPSPRATGAPAGGGAGRSGSDGRSGPGVGGAGERTGAPGEAGAAGEAPRQEFVPLAPEQLMFTGPEEADIARLWPLFRTPRRQAIHQHLPTPPRRARARRGDRPLRGHGRRAGGVPSRAATAGRRHRPRTRRRRSSTGSAPGSTRPSRITRSGCGTGRRSSTP